MKKAKRDMLTMAVLMTVGALFYFWFIPSQIRVVANSKTNFTSQSFPKLMAAALFLVALVGFCNALWTFLKARKTEEASKQPLTAKALREMLAPYAAFLLILAYALAFRQFGFLLSTAIFIPAFLALLRCKKWQYYAGAYVFCGAIYLIFIHILHVPLP